MHGLIPPVSVLQKQLQPLADTFGLQALPLHIHEIALAFTLYHVIFTYLAPHVSNWWFPHHYNKFGRLMILEWNLQCVSMVQSILICVLGLWVIRYDIDRQQTSPEARVWGYSGSAGSVQAFATGYFLWDLMVTLQHLDDLGLPVLIHAFSCLAVYMIGFRPVFNYYSCVFVLFELSTPFLNIHLFIKQLGMEGSPIQLYNGILLIMTFFSTRLLYGGYWSIQWYMDVFHVSTPQSSGIKQTIPLTNANAMPNTDSKNMATLPLWLIAVFMTSNILLNGLNFIWFGKMIEAIRHKDKILTVKKE